MPQNCFGKIESHSLQNYMNKWIELRLPNTPFFKFYLTYLNQGFVAGYLSRSTYKTIYCKSFLSYGPQYVQQFTPHQGLNSWVLLEFKNHQFSHFFLTYINENFIGGYLIRNMIKGIDSSILHYQQFFEEYDHRFHPLLLPHNNHIPIKEREKRIQIVKQAETTLSLRLEKRVLATKEGKIPNPLEMPNLAITDVEYLSNKQIELYKEFFLDETENLDYKRIQTCFELFSNGEIQGNKYPGSQQPDSISEFLFAEFALQAIESDIDPEIWSELLKTFVKTQEIFIQVYRPNNNIPPKLQDYSYLNFRYYKQVNENQKQRLRKKYDCMLKCQLEEAFSRNLLQAISPNTLD